MKLEGFNSSKVLIGLTAVIVVMLLDPYIARGLNKLGIAA